MIIDQLKSVGNAFELPGRVDIAAPYGNGHINDTYRVEAGHCQFIFQRVNHHIFQDVPQLMTNIQRVTDHLRLKVGELPPPLRQQVLTLILTKSGHPFFVDDQGNYWRVYEFLENTETLELVDTPERARDGARAFALFQGMLMDFPSPVLHEVIPDFHYTPKRLESLKRAIAEDSSGRLKNAPGEVAFALEREALTQSLTDKIAGGQLPVRITHNDTKINNIRFDLGTGKGHAVIDLDTVMPGLIHYDFGDLIRTCCFEGEEDALDRRSVRLRPDILRAVVLGFLEGGSRFFTANEIDSLPVAGKLICLETGIRFLTDYLQGDTYFKTARPNQNLDRARIQFQRVKLLEAEHHSIKGLIIEARSTNGAGS